jgi:hypothetical protein
MFHSFARQFWRSTVVTYHFDCPNQNDQQKISIFEKTPWGPKEIYGKKSLGEQALFCEKKNHKKDRVVKIYVCV